MTLFTFFISNSDIPYQTRLVDDSSQIAQASQEKVPERTKEFQWFRQRRKSSECNHNEFWRFFLPSSSIWRQPVEFEANSFFQAVCSVRYRL